MSKGPFVKLLLCSLQVRRSRLGISVRVEDASFSGKGELSIRPGVHLLPSRLSAVLIISTIHCKYINIINKALINLIYF